MKACPYTLKVERNPMDRTWWLATSFGIVAMGFTSRRAAREEKWRRDNDIDNRWATT